MAVESTRIRWVRLKRIMSDITGRDVMLYATTEMKKETIAKLDLTGNKAEIVVNLRRVKGLNELINTLSHEGAHIMLMGASHDEQFKSMREKFRKELVDKYIHYKKIYASEET